MQVAAAAVKRQVGYSSPPLFNESRLLVLLRLVYLTDREDMSQHPLRFHVITANDRAPEYRSLLTSRVEPETPADRQAREARERREALDKEKRQQQKRGSTVVVVVIVIVVVVAIVAAIAVCVSQSQAAPTQVIDVPAPTTAAIVVQPTAAPGSSGTPDVDVSVVCNAPLSGEDLGLCLGIFSYDNPSGDAVDVVLGANNIIMPEPLATSQPIHFVSGTRFGAVTAKWNCTEHSSLSWLLRSGDGVSVATTSAAIIPSCPSLHSLIN